MGFETEKNKLNKINEGSVVNDKDKGRQKNIDLSIDTRVDQLNRTEGIVSKLHDLSRDWVQLSAVSGYFDPVTNEWLPESDDWDSQATNFDISLGVFDIRLLPYVRVNFVFKPCEERDNNRILQWVNQGFFFTATDIAGNENFKDVTLHLSCDINDFRPEGDQGEWSLERPWKCKVIITVANPRLFI